MAQKKKPKEKTKTRANGAMAKPKGTKAEPKKADRKKAAAAPQTTGNGHQPIPTTDARSGDLIVIDSAQVGSPAREGEILRVIAGDVSVSYRVRWSDGHESVISPGAGAAHIVRG